MCVNIFYVSKTGRHIMRRMPWVEMPEAMERLYKRRIDATAKEMDGRVIGRVWKGYYKWNWYCETEQEEN